MSNVDPYGIMSHECDGKMRTDYFYRVSLKCVIRNEQGYILSVKEAGRSNWDLPGGGMDHGESIKTAIAREMKEEIGHDGDFDYAIIGVEEAGLTNHNFWQIRLIFVITLPHADVHAGEHSDEICYKNPEDFKTSSSSAERLIYKYGQI